MTPKPLLCMALVALVAASNILLVRCQFATEENSSSLYKEIQEEWVRISANNTRRVFNFGIGSLTSWGSRQHTQEHKTLPEKPSLISPGHIRKAVGIRRSFNFCWRYMAAAAHPCRPNDDEGNDSNCPPVLGVFFEVTEVDYPTLRSRETVYKHIPVAPVGPMALDPDAYYFAWGGDVDVDPPCNFEKRISQAYWDFIIGGLLAWDGQLLDTNRYTWSLDSELELGAQEIAKIVHHPPSLSLEDRRKMAVEMVASTEKSDYEWMDDRSCPYTSNSIITPGILLLYNNNTETFGKRVPPSALGTASPLATQTFYDYVDDILIEGGWENGAKNSIWNRTNPCPESIFINRLHDNHEKGWEPNPYFDDIQQWLFILTQ